MSRLHRLIPLLLAFPILGLGCSNSPTETTNIYTVQIQTAEGQTETRIASFPQEEVMMKELLDSAGIPTTEIKQGEEKIVLTSLNGVIATKSKAWHLYLNSYPTSLTNLVHMPVRASDIIEWKYESQ